MTPVKWQTLSPTIIGYQAYVALVEDIPGTYPEHPFFRWIEMVFIFENLGVGSVWVQKHFFEEFLKMVFKKHPENSHVYLTSKVVFGSFDTTPAAFSRHDFSGYQMGSTKCMTLVEGCHRWDITTRSSQNGWVSKHIRKCSHPNCMDVNT